MREFGTAASLLFVVTLAELFLSVSGELLLGTALLTLVCAVLKLTTKDPYPLEGPDHNFWYRRRHPYGGATPLRKRPRIVRKP